MTTFLTSDQHYGHRNIIDYCGRPFASLHEMHTELTRRHNAVVGSDDDVWHLGDFALDDRIVGKVLPLLNGRHRLIAGNHDRCHSCHRRSQAYVAKYLGFGFIEVVERRVLETPIGPVLMTHMPRVDGGDPRYPEYRPNDWTGPILHGHVHERWKKNGNQVNVGVDQWDFTPVALETALLEFS